MSEEPLFETLANSGSEQTEYAMHAEMPDGTEDWMLCRDLQQLRYRMDYWTERGWKCTALKRTITKSGWRPR